jgi:hypothetical protein
LITCVRKARCGIVWTPNWRSSVSAWLQAVRRINRCCNHRNRSRQDLGPKQAEVQTPASSATEVVSSQRLDSASWGRRQVASGKRNGLCQAVRSVCRGHG